MQAITQASIHATKDGINDDMGKCLKVVITQQDDDDFPLLVTIDGNRYDPQKLIKLADLIKKLR